MNYYQHHIGDFIKVTARLSDSQTMAYLRLLWVYYDTEKPLPNDSKLLAFQLGTTEEVVEMLLTTFFVKHEDGWHQTRCDKEIQEYQAFKEKKIAAGKASAEKKGYSRSTPVQQPFNTCSTDVQLTTNHYPLSNDSLTFSKEKVVEDKPSTPLKIIDCPHEKILDLWQEVLPEMPQHLRSQWNAARQQALRVRWKAIWTSEDMASEEEALDYWRRLFQFIRQSKFLMGKVSVKDRPAFQITLEWLIKPANWSKVVEGKYHE